MCKNKFKQKLINCINNIVLAFFMCTCFIIIINIYFARRAKSKIYRRVIPTCMLSIIFPNSNWNLYWNKITIDVFRSLMEAIDVAHSIPTL